MAEPTKAQLLADNEALRNTLTRLTEQQTATSEILGLISSSPSDVQPVFQTIVETAVRLLQAASGTITRLNGDSIELAALTSTDDTGDAHLRGYFPVSLNSQSTHARAIRDRAPFNVADSEADARISEASRANARARGFRSQLTVPMLRREEPLGTIAVSRRTTGAFTDEEIALLQTFADQAVIAIENVRLFNETREALEQQTATSEILRVIAGSPTDVQPVFESIVRSAAVLCGGVYGAVYRRFGDMVDCVAQYGLSPEAQEYVRRNFPRPVTAGRSHHFQRALLEGTVVSIPDIAAEHDVSPRTREFYVRHEGRSVVLVPLVRQGEILGVLGVGHRDIAAFADRHVELLKTFADQAVIAIENVRLFTELQGSNCDLTTALDTQTATSDILRVISRSQTDVQPVFDTIVRNAVVLCDALFGAVFRFDGDLIHLVAHHNFTPEVLELVSHLYPMRPNREQATGRVILTGKLVHLHDVLIDPEYRREVATRGGWRSMLAVPMSHEDTTVGMLWVARGTAGPFPDNQIDLLKTFADQALIAIENVRLFTELQASNRELTTALDTQTATSDILRVISGSRTDVQPVFDAIVESAVRLLRANTGVVTRIVGDQIEIAALTGADDAGDAALRARFPQPLRSEGVPAQTMRDRTPLNVADTETDPRASEALRVIARARGYRSLAVVPLLRHDEVVGAIAVTRREPGGFHDDGIALLKTFADQAVIAIENARLLSELQTRTRELEVASQHKSEFLASMSHELRTPLNAVIGFSDVLLQGMFGEPNEKQTEYLRDILASGQHLLSLINDILDLSKIEAGRMDLDVAAFDLPLAIDDAMLLMRERAGRRGITLERHVDAHVGQIHADQRKVKQVLLNLLSNAVKFTPEGGRIDVGAKLANGMAEISVTDTGIGIAPEDHDAVFEEFRQVGKSDKKAEGTGLGLALCRKFVELHGGRIWLTSEVDKGSTFTFAIPIGGPATGSSEGR
jgi:GAF domain-containing protein